MDDSLIIGILCIVALVLFLMSGIWIAIGMGIVGVIALFILNTSTTLVAYAPINIAQSFVMTAIPLFIFMGSILQQSGASRMIYRGASKWLAWAPGGLFHANVGSCALFASISGSSIATAATIGTMAIPSLKERGYDEKIALGSLAAGGTLGILIPPSITMIVYGEIAGVSVGRLFAGGVVPGIMISLMFMIYIAIRAIKNPLLAPRESFSVRGLLSGFVDLWPIFVLMFLVLGGIFSGFVSPTEAAAIGASGALLIALALRQLTWKGFIDSLMSAVRNTSMLLFIIIGATMLGSVFARVGTTRALVALITGLDIPVLGIILVVVLMYLVLGCFIEGLAMVVLTVPVILPALEAIGIDPVWFGVVLVVLVELALLTPPVGLSLYVIQGIAQAEFMTVLKGVIPFFFIMFAGLGLMIAFPHLVTWLPTLIFGG